MAVAGGCKGGRVLTGAALLGADPWHAQHPGCMECLTSSSIPAIALVSGGACKRRANGYMGRCAIISLNSNFPPPPFSRVSSLEYAEPKALNVTPGGLASPKAVAGKGEVEKALRRKENWLVQWARTKIIHPSGHLQFN